MFTDVHIFLHPSGLSQLEFEGYVACVLTQILRELEARSTGQAAFDFVLFFPKVNLASPIFFMKPISSNQNPSDLPRCSPGSLDSLTDRDDLSDISAATAPSTTCAKAPFAATLAEAKPEEPVEARDHIFGSCFFFLFLCGFKRNQL